MESSMFSVQLANYFLHFNLHLNFIVFQICNIINFDYFVSIFHPIPSEVLLQFFFYVNNNFLSFTHFKIVPISKEKNFKITVLFLVIIFCFFNRSYFNWNVCLRVFLINFAARLLNFLSFFSIAVFTYSSSFSGNFLSSYLGFRCLSLCFLSS